MPYQHDTYDRRVQLGASRRRREDAESLFNVGRWAGAVYLGGYAIECALKSLICHNAGVNNFKDTQCQIQGASLHDLAKLLNTVPAIQRAIEYDRTHVYKLAWNLILRLWDKDHLRYWDKMGSQQDSEHFITAVRKIHEFLLSQQGEAS